jgi:hypothetical protein
MEPTSYESIALAFELIREHCHRLTQTHALNAQHRDDAAPQTGTVLVIRIMPDFFKTAENILKNLIIALV